MIAALARGAQVLDEKRYLDHARAALSFIFRELRDEDGRLLHRWRDGEAAGPAILGRLCFSDLGDFWRAMRHLSIRFF